MKIDFKSLLAISVVFGLGLFTGKTLLVKDNGADAGASTNGKKPPLYWVAPMDKNYRRDGPGKSPMGMDLVPVYEEDNAGSDDSSVSISPVVENNLGVKVAKVRKEKLTIPVDTVGTVQHDESRITHIHSRVEGWIEKLGVAASGDRVSKGQTLFELYSPALVSAQEEYLAAVRSGNKNLINASASRLFALGITPEQVNALRKRKKVEQTISFKADRDGVVIDLNVRKGMFIKPAMEVLSFGTLDSIWVIGEIFERQAYLVQQGQSVEARLSSLPGETWQGTVNYIYPELDPKSRTLPVRIRLTNDEFRLKPNMLMDLRISTGSNEELLSIPGQSLIKAAQHTRVVKALGQGRYKSVPVIAGLEGISQDENGLIEHRIQVLEGLEEGDQVVTSAQFLIDSESNVDAELMRMEEAEEASMSAPAGKVVVTSGQINRIMSEMGMVSITHDPIPEWEWPTMKMDFQVAEGVALDALKEGQTVQFELEKTGDWDYLITGFGDEIQNPNKAGEGDVTSFSQRHSLPEGAVRTSGQIKMLMLDMNMLEVVHEPIPEWSWPVMSMTFVVADGELVSMLKEGDEVNFTLKELENGDYLMSDIEPKK